MRSKSVSENVLSKNGCIGFSFRSLVKSRAAHSDSSEIEQMPGTILSMVPGFTYLSIYYSRLNTTLSRVPVNSLSRS